MKKIGIEMKKIGIIGTNSSGKTTLCYEVLWKLKRAGVSCDGVLKQDRRISFDKPLLETNPLAQWSIISNQIKAEADMAMRPGLEILVSDRSPLDLYAYYVATHGENYSLSESLINWCNTTFERIYLLEPVIYAKEGGRPSEEFRDKVFKILCDVVSLVDKGMVRYESCEPDSINTFIRENVANEILALVGKQLQEVDLAIIPEVLGADVLVGGSYAFNRATKWSDVDVYIVQGNSDKRTQPYLQAKVQKILGVNVDLTICNRHVWDYLKAQGFKEFKQKV